MSLSAGTAIASTPFVRSEELIELQPSMAPIKIPFPTAVTRVVADYVLYSGTIEEVASWWRVAREGHEFNAREPTIGAVIFKLNELIKTMKEQLVSVVLLGDWQLFALKIAQIRNNTFGAMWYSDEWSSIKPNIDLNEAIPRMHPTLIIQIQELIPPSYKTVMEPTSLPVTYTVVGGLIPAELCLYGLPKALIQDEDPTHPRFQSISSGSKIKERVSAGIQMKYKSIPSTAFTLL